MAQGFGLFKDWDRYGHLGLPKENHEWRVITRGTYKDYEISVGWTGEPHGFLSWGWTGRSKILISRGSADAFDNKISKAVFKQHKQMAQTMADAFNAKGYKP